MHAETDRRVTAHVLPPTTVAAGRHGLLHILKRLWTDWRARRSLSNLPDDILRDIGLSRADVERETLQPFWTPLDYDSLERQRRRACRPATRYY